MTSRLNSLVKSQDPGLMLLSTSPTSVLRRRNKEISRLPSFVSKGKINTSSSQTSKEASVEVNNQFMMDDSSGSDADSIESITKSLSNISKRKFGSYLGSSRSKENSTESSPNITDAVEIKKESSATTVNREFKENKDILFNLSKTTFYTNPKGLVYSNMNAIRNTIINFQVKNNIYVKTYDFIMLLSTILLLSGKVLHCIVQINIALLPLYEIAIHVIRFVIEQLALISQTHSNHEKIKMSIMCFLQTMTLVLVTIFIYGSVLIPVSYIGMLIFYKIGYFLLS